MRNARSLSAPSGAVQRAAVAVCEAGRGDQWPSAPEAAVYGGLWDHPLGGAALIPLCEALPGVRPPAAGEKHRAASHYRLVLQSPSCSQSCLQHLQSQLKRCSSDLFWKVLINLSEVHQKSFIFP